MMFHYFNILLCSLPLNILLTPSYEINMKSHNRSTLHTINTKSVKIHRSLCECNLYTSTYDNDPEMKEVMQQFDDRSAQRFKEYEEMLQYKRKQCKKQCDKDIQKIILKDKIEKELTENFSALQTHISTNDIPTCICEKSVADKVEKTCLKCGGILGGGIVPGWSLVSGLGYMAWTRYIAAKVLEEGIKKGLEVGLVKVTEIATQMIRDVNKVPSIDILQKITTGNFSDGVSLYDIFKTIDSTMSTELETQGYYDFSLSVQSIADDPAKLKWCSQKVADVTNAVADGEASVLTEAAPVTSGLNTAIIASIVAIVVIILVMLIIYLILRYRRKKKIHKKLQYIKLLQQ
ncbi:hypothetical protein PFMALIP_01737 [Plasmodium falciparum MaliPS096_E11]|uniref:Surface antigen n=1 Tax=Plasmodium falciparum MaliPS096_E11 TaxID=1036727 RepID=A0A024WT74_PLAFA|nr:hypothetical protein PFMALIP_01737 [Plasmodium falciparum MaliPS096_E11]